MNYLYNPTLKKYITLVIISYKSFETIKPILKKYSNILKIIIIENSQDKVFKQYVEKKFKTVQVYFQKNIGYGGAINFACKHVKTKYFFAINPDLKFKLICLVNLLKAAENLKGKFGGLNPVNVYQSSKNKKKN